MRTKILPLLLLFALPVLTMASEQDINRGFNPNGMYGTGDIDTINLFNGNLLVNIPLSPKSYPLNGGFSYGLHLIYTGTPWDFVPDLTHQNISGYKMPVPNRRSNAGLGWRVTMGRMRIPNGPLSGSFGYSYESVDGSRHPFFSTLHWNDTPDPNGNILYTLDGTYLRLTISSTSLDLAFPDGMVHSFDPSTGLLKSIRTPFDSPAAPSVSVAYGPSTDVPCPNSAAACWKITDATGGSPTSPSRTHWVTFNADPDLFDQIRADKIILAGVGGNALTYQLNYADNGTTTLYTDTTECYDVGPGTPPSYPVPMLSSILLPDGTNYSFDYFLDPAQCSQGSLKTLTLPTGGKIAYTYQNYMSAISSYGVPSAPGVLTRTRDGGVWTYTPTAADPGVFPQADKNRDPDAYSDYNPPLDCSISDTQYRELTVTVARPDGSSTKNYFSLARRDAQYFCYGSQSEPWVGAEYGLPITHRTGTSYTVSTGTRYLSSQTYGPDGVLLRTTYLTYDDDGGPYPGAGTSNRRVLGSLTVFNDDGAKYIDVLNSSFDGLGHYRQTVTTDFGLGTLNRTTFTDYNRAQGVYLQGNPGGFTMLAGDAPWILNTFDYQQTSEGTKVSRSDDCFTNGTLTRSRARASLTGVTGPNDVITDSVLDATGNLTKELSYGGDTQVVGTSNDLCSMALPGTAAYEVRHGYDHGVRSTSDYYSGGNAFLNLLNLGVDPTGVVTSQTDASGIQTTYSYDLQNRLTSVAQPGVTTKTYAYTAAVVSPFAGAKVTETQGDLVNTYTYDAIGRLANESRLAPDGSTVTRTTSYDAFDRKNKVNDWVSSGTGPETDFSYDSFGRLVSTTTPDGKTTQYLYAGTTSQPAHQGAGVSSMTRRSEIATSLTGVESIDVTESYDSLGRLSSVTQKSGPTNSTSTTGADVTTTYSYDVASRLTGVKMGAATGSVQNRIFDYDNRGFLRWESQPESGVTSYAYDARGHLMSRLQSGANSMFDLTYSYDAAERPLTVKGRDPLAPTAFRPIKEFVYGTTNNVVVSATDYAKGKLVSATRHNYGDPNVYYSPYGPEPEYDVQDTYNYLDSAGRLTTRTTTLSMITLFGTTTLQHFTTSESYDGLGLPRTITYPTCIGCGVPQSDPDRHLMARTYSRGRLKSLTDYDGQMNTLGYVSDISYWPNGMRNTVVHWAAPLGKNVSDVQTIDNMPRPSQLQFGTYDRCVRPTFAIQPMSAPLVNGAATLTVTAAGTAPMTYDWYQGGQLIGGASSSSISVSAVGDYYAVARNACGYETSETAHVSTDCPSPSTGEIKAVLQPDGSWILTPNPIARQQNRAFLWTRLPDGTALGTSETLAIGVQSSTTTYRLTISDVCGSSSGDVTISVPVPITNGLNATWDSTHGYISVTWPPISGATQYAVERRHDGGDWEIVGTPAGSPYHDTGIVAGTTYVYQVESDHGGHTNYDVATTVTFTAAIAGQTVGVAPFNDMLRATNLVRAAAGWPALDWSNILAPSDPLPSPGSAITARQVLACRARINEALQAVGVLVGDYTSPDLLNVTISAATINEVQQRAQ